MDWNSSFLWSITGILSGLIVNFLFYYLARERKSLLYNISTTPIISNSISQIEGLSIKYNENKVNDFFTSTITIKNNGIYLIEPNDIIPPLSLMTNGEFFTDSIKLHTEKNNNNLQIIFDSTGYNISQKATIQFDYLLKKDTISFTIFHTGDITLSGNLKKGTIKKSKKEKKHLHLNINISFILGIIFQIFINIISNFISHYLIK